MMTIDMLQVLAGASAEAYEIKPGQEFVQDLGLVVRKVLIESDGAVRGFVARHPCGFVISVKGTASARDLLVDGEFLKRPFRGTMVHEGFLSEHDQILRKLPMGELRSGPPIFVTGHSLGGAVASLLGLSLKTDYPELEVHVATFGSPYAGDHGFSNAFKKKVNESIRVVHDYDIVPRLNWLGSKHVDELLHLDRQGKKVGITRGILTQIGHWVQLVSKDLEGIALNDHHVAYYVAAVSKYSERLAKKEGAVAG